MSENDEDERTASTLIRKNVKISQEKRKIRKANKMLNEEKKRWDLDALYEEYHLIKNEMLPIGLRLGWYDEAGSMQPLQDLMAGRLPEKEEEEIREKENLPDALEFIGLQWRRNKIAKKIINLENRLGISPEESKA